MASIDGRNPISSIKGIGTEDNTLFLLSDRFASLNFDGFIPRDNTFIYASDLTIGQTIFSSDPTAKDNSFFITRIDTESVTVEGIEQTAYSLYFLGENDLEEKYTYGAENINGSFSQNHLFNVYKDDISDIVLGNNGWMITNQGNAIFSNVFVRGTVEATSGKIDGILKVGESKNGYPLVTLGKNIFNSTSFDGSTSEHSGLFLNKNNYLMGYDVPTNVYVTSIVATNSTEDNILRKATFTLAGHTLAVNDLVSITGFTEDKFLELDNVFPVKEITTNTFTVYYKNEIAGTTNPISVNLKAQSFALNNIYDITSLSLSEVITAEDTSSLKVYFNGNYTGLFAAGQIIDLNSILNSSLNINGQYRIISITEVVGEDNDYLTIETPRVTAGTYTTDVGQITLYDTNYKFKVGDNDNSMSYNSYTGALTVTGTINASSGNFTNAVTVGKPNLSYSVSNKQLTTNEAILTTNTVHSFVVGDSVTIAGVDATFNGTYTVKSVPTGNIFIYDKTATNVASTAVSPVGTVSRGVANEGTIFVGYGTNQITINGTGTDTTSAIFAGVGNYGNSDTGFFMDASGRFSLKDKLTFSGNLLNPVLTVNGKITAQTLSVGGAGGINYDPAVDNIIHLGSDVVITGGVTATSLTVGTDPNQIIISPTAVSGNPGMAITGSGDFIRNTGAFRLGGASGISYSGSGTVTVGTGVNVNGNISGASGTFTGSLSGSTITGGTIKTSATTGNGSTAGVIIDSTSARFFNNSSATAVTTISTATGALTATSANITGTITATAGIFSGNIQTTGKIYSGTLDGGGLLTSGVEVASTGIKGIINGVTAFNLPADGVTAPTITNFQVLNAKITGESSNAYLIAGKLSDNITVRGDRTGVDATGAIFNTVSNTPTTYAGGTGFYFNETGKFRFGTPTNYIRWDGTNLDITGDVRIGGTAGSTVVSNASTGAAKPDVYRQISAPTGTIKTGSIWYDTDDNNKTYVYDGTAWQATETNAAGVGLGNVSNLTPQNQAQTGLISGTTITGGGITLSGGGNIKGGQTGYDSGTGFFLGYDTSAYKFSIGNSSENKLIWNGTNLSVTGEIKATSGWIGGAITGWQITDAIIQSTDRLGSDNQVHLETGSGPFKNTSKIYIGPSGSDWNTSAQFYADSEGYFSVGKGDSSLTYDPGTAGNGLITVTGKVQATSGYIGGKDLGWKFGNNGILQTGEGQGKLALASSVTQFSGGLASLSIERILCDNEFEDYQADFGSVYVTVKAYSIPMTRYVSSGSTTVTGTSTANHGLATGDKIIISEATTTEQSKLNGTWTIASTPTPTTFTFVVTTALASATYTTNIGIMGVGVSSGMRGSLPNVFTDTIMKFDLTLAPTSSFKTLFDGKSFSVVDVIESKKVFFVKEIDNYDPDGGFPEISSPQATWDLYPVYGSATSTQLSLYFTEIFTDDEFTSTTGGLAVGNTLTLEADVLAGVSAGNYVIYSIGTQDLDEGTILYNSPDGYNARFGKIILTRTGTAITLQESGVGGVYLPDPAGYYTLVFYPEDSGVVLNNTAEGYYSYTTPKPQLSFYDELALTASDGYYYMWAGDDDPDLAEFVIKKSNAVNANNLTVQNKATGQTYVSQSQESTFAPFSVTGAATGSSFVPMIKSRVAGATKTRISVLGQIHNTDNTINTVLHNLNSDGTEDQKFYFRNDGVFQAPEFVGKGAVPVGSIVMWYQTSIPTGWLRCDGAAVDSTSYPSLYAMMTTTPNLTGRFPLGVSGTTYPLGGVGGAASASYITVTAHTHTINAFNANITEGTIANNTTNHSHGVTGNTGISDANGSRSYSTNLTNILTATANHAHADGNLTTTSAGGTSTTDHSHAINAFSASITEGTNEANTAASSTVATMPPYLALYFIIYAG